MSHIKHSILFCFASNNKHCVTSRQHRHATRGRVCAGQRVTGQIHGISRVVVLVRYSAQHRVLANCQATNSLQVKQNGRQYSQLINYKFKDSKTRNKKVNTHLRPAPFSDWPRRSPPASWCSFDVVGDLRENEVELKQSEQHKCGQFEETQLPSDTQCRPFDNQQNKAITEPEHSGT